MSLKITKTYKATSGKAPFTYTLLPSDTCITMDKTSGSFETEVTIEFTLNNANCLSETVDLEITDDNGCSDSITITFDDPCTSYVVSEITEISNNIFSLSYNEPSTIEWIYDTSIFSAAIEGDSISLTIKEGANINEPTILQAIVTNTKGCVEERSYTISYQKPSFKSTSVSLETNCTTREGFFTVELPTDNTIDWSTFNITLYNNLEIVKRFKNKIWFKVINMPPVGSTSSVLTRKYTVANYSGITSDETYLYVQVTKCTDIEMPQLFSPNANITDVAIGETIEIPIIKNDGVYVNTLIPVSGTTQTLVDSKHMTSDYSNVTIDDEKITYELTNTTTDVVELIQYNGIDVNGNISKTVQVVVSFDTLPSPVYPVSFVNICTECGNQTPLLDITQFATGDIDNTKTLITSQPSIGTLVQSSSGAVSYSSPNQLLSGVNFDYKIASIDGVYNPLSSTVNLINRCSGVPTTTITNITCSAKAFNLEDLMSGYLSTSRLWEDYDGAYTAEGGVIANDTTTGGVDFTSLPVGTYKFKNTATFVSGTNELNCKTEYITIIEIYNGQTGSLGQITGSNVSGTIHRFQSLITGTIDPSTIAVTVDSSPATFVSGPTITNGVLEFTLNLTLGSTYSIVLTANNGCGNIVTTTMLYGI